MIVDRSGIYEMTAEEYHADCCPAPSLTSSVARVLLASSPLHAWFQHPKLNPEFRPEESERFDLGRAAHTYLLEGQSGFVIVDAPDWRTKAAREAREIARLDGKVALLKERWGDVVEMVHAARRQLASHGASPQPFTCGDAEQTLVWREGGLWCRARLDWLHRDRRVIDDLKTTGETAEPDRWIRGPLFSTGYDVQAAFYLRGLKAVLGIDADFRFVVQENYPPFALTVIGLTPEVLAIAERKVKRAIRDWAHCLSTNTWPAYPTETCYAELPPWERARWEERELRAPAVNDDRSLSDQLMGDAA